MEEKLLRASLTLLLIFSLFSLSINVITIVQAQTHDIAVTNVTPFRTVVESGDLVNITVIVKNLGTESESFNVTLSRDSVTIEQKTVADLMTGQNRTLVFTWDTVDTIQEIYALTTKEKSYNITAVASPVIGETNIGDNTLVATSKIRVVSQYIAVKPQHTVDETLTTGKNYTISINTDYNGADVWGYNVQFTYNPTVLECIEVQNGDLITTDIDPSATFVSNINNTIGEVSAGAFFFYNTPLPSVTTSGPGTLARVTFEVVTTGISNITLGEDDTYLMVYNPDLNPDQPFKIIDKFSPSSNHILSGYFSNAINQIIDIAITSVTPFPTSVTQGETVNVTVAVENRGTLYQTFDVAVYYAYTPGFPGQNVIGTKTMQSLAADASKTLVFPWDTTNVKEGNYTITALVSGVQGDINPANNKVDSNERVAVKLEELRPLPITELIIGAVVIIAVIAVIYFILRKRRKKQPLE